VNSTVHVLAPRELWRPLRTGIEEAWWIFLTRRAGRAVKWSQQPACVALGPPGVQSCQCQAIPATGGVTTRRSDASSLMSLLAKLVFFHLRGGIFSGLRPFEVCTTEIHCPFRNESFLGPSPSLRDSKRKGCFSKHLPSIRD
jgi:hypothetical protein